MQPNVASRIKIVTQYEKMVLKILLLREIPRFSHMMLLGFSVFPTFSKYLL